MPSRFVRRHRARIALFAIACLLLQQLAVAAVVCEVALPTVEAPATRCHEAQGARADEPDALCSKHCAPDTATGAEARTVGVPALPPVPFPSLTTPVLADSLPGTSPGKPHSTAPPATLQHARLLI